MKLAYLFLPMLLSIWTSAATAGWPENGLLISDTTSNHLNGEATLLRDDFGGLYVCWHSFYDSAGATIQNPFVQRFTPSGAISPGWPVAGVQISSLPVHQGGYKLVPDGNGGMYVIWHDRRAFGLGNAEDVYALRVLDNGTAAPGWPTDGLALVAKTKPQQVFGAAVDGFGGLFVSWDDRNPRSGDMYDAAGIHVLHDGSLAPGWPVNGKPIAPTAGDQAVARLVADGYGGVYVAYASATTEVDLYARHLDSQGNPDPAWTSTDLLLSDAPGNQAAHQVCPAPDGFYVVWEDSRTQPPGTGFNEAYLDIYAQHVLANGTIAPGWPASGLPLCVFADAQRFPEIAADGNGGFIAVWEDRREGLTGWDLYGIRVNADGTRAPGWLESGSPAMVGSESQQNFGIDSDGSGGMFVVAEGDPSGQIWIQHVLANGEPQIGWPIDGQRITPGISSQVFPRVMWDGSGGAYIGWADARYGGSEVFVKHYGADGPTGATVSLVSAETEPGVASLTWYAAGSTREFSLERRTNGGRFVIVGSATPASNGRVMFTDHVPEPGTYFYRLAWTDASTTRASAEVVVEIPSAFILSLAGLTPNPAMGGEVAVSFTLPKRAAGNLSLFDVAGRRVASQDLSDRGPGRYQVRMAEHARIPAGVYWVRLTHAEHVLTARGAVVR